MNGISNRHFIFYFLIAIIHLTAILIGSGAEIAATITKPLLLPALMFVFYRLTRDIVNRQKKMIFSALFFSWLGDVTLLFQQQNARFFLIGLIFFLLAHICFILAFLQGGKTSPSLLRRMPWVIFFFIAYGGIILAITYQGLGDMLVPVIVYMCVILLMGMSALNRYGKVAKKSFAEVFAGAIIFMLSDSLLAINKFTQPIPSASFLIMLTYITAQYLIVKGILDDMKSPEATDIS